MVFERQLFGGNKQLNPKAPARQLTKPPEQRSKVQLPSASPGGPMRSLMSQKRPPYCEKKIGHCSVCSVALRAKHHVFV